MCLLDDPLGKVLVLYFHMRDAHHSLPHAIACVDQSPRRDSKYLVLQWTGHYLLEYSVMCVSMSCFIQDIELTLHHLHDRATLSHGFSPPGVV